MALAVTFTEEQHEKLKKLRADNLSWDVIAKRLGISRERLIKEGRKIGLAGDAKRRRRIAGAEALENAQTAGDIDTSGFENLRVDSRLALPAGHPVALEILNNAPRVEDRWKDEE